MPFVYRYTDTQDNIVKYIGIVFGKTRTITIRLREHSDERIFQDTNWKIDYFEVNSRTDAECWEAHLIAVYKTYKYLNHAKAQWGISDILDGKPIDWIEYVGPTKYTHKRLDTKQQKVCNEKRTEIQNGITLIDDDSKKSVYKKFEVIYGRRRDKLGRNLPKGVYQKTSGMYEVRLETVDGKIESKYSWRLLDGDKVPQGKADSPSIFSVINETWLEGTEYEKHEDECLKIAQRLIAEKMASNHERQFSVSECFKRYMREADISAKTKDSYFWSFKKYYEYILKMDIRRVTSEDIYNSLVISLKDDNISQLTVRNICSIARNVFQYCIQSNIIGTNPAECVFNELRFDGVI